MKTLNREVYKEIVNECNEISIRKNNDYGCEALLAFKEKGIVVRLNDKMQRLINLVWNESEQKVSDEKVEDTALDMINYSIYLVMMLRGELNDK